MTQPDGTPAPVSRLPEPDEEWRRHVRDVAATHVAPRVGAMDEAARYDDALVPALAGAGLLGVEVPEAYGGAGGDLFHVVLAIEELARVDPAVSVLVDVQNALVASALLRHGSGDQKRRHLPRLAGGTVGAYALSEDQAGSDAFAMTTRAERDGDGWVLTGRKRWTTNGAEAGLFLVFARTDAPGAPAPEVTAFLVGGDADGLSRGERVGKLGIRASSTCDLVLDGVRVGRPDVVGRPGEGGLLVVETLAVGKLGIAAQLVGLAQGALDAAAAYARERRQFGRRIADHQGVAFPLADTQAELTAARTLLYDTARRLQAGGDSRERVQATSTAKYVASQVAERAASRAVETCGGNGFTTAYPAEKLYRDAKIGTIYEGTSNMQLRTLAAHLLGPPEADADGVRPGADAAAAGGDAAAGAHEGSAA